MSDCTTVSNPCGTSVLQSGYQVAGKDFSVCLPFGGTLASKKGIISYTAGKAPTDGTYSTITIKDGCITGVGHIEGATYTSNPCDAIPSSCSSSATDGGSVSISNTVNNLTSLDSTGSIVTTLSVNAGSGISIKGAGTTANPLIISTASNSNANKCYINTGNTWIIISGSGSQSSPYVISHRQVLGSQRTISGMTFDAAGHLVSYSAPTGSATIKGIVDGVGISTNMNPSTGIATVALAEVPNPINKTVEIGGYRLTFDKYNRVTKLVEPSSATGLARTGGVSHIFPAMTNSSESFRITLAEPAYIQVNMLGSNMSNITISINSRKLSVFSNSNIAVAVSTAIYAAGSHTITVSGSCAANSVATALAVDVD